jgi:hypothetical protein
VLLFVILGAWLAVVFFGLTLCRLATLSDDSHAVALDEWIATINIEEHQAGPPDSPAEQHASGIRRSAYRAAG